MRIKQSLGRSVIITVSVFFLAGCAQTESIAQDPTKPLGEISIADVKSAPVDLDFDKALATTPITQYLINQNPEFQRLYYNATERLIASCMSTAGYPEYKYEPLAASDFVPQSDTVYGFWDVKSASVYGILPNPERGIPKQKTNLNLSQEGFNQLTKCGQDAARQLQEVGSELEQLSLADRIQGNAASAALKTKQGKEANNKLKTCLANKNLLVDPESGYVSSEYAKQGKEAEITSAVGEAECNISTGRIKTLYELQAKYETAYIQKYAGELESVKSKKQKLVDTLNKIIED